MQIMQNIVDEVKPLELINHQYMKYERDEASWTTVS
jgi:hypothetical protein